MRRLPLLLLVAALAACDRTIDPITLAPTDSAVAGTFTLQSANGHIPPILAFVTVTDEWDLTSDKIAITADGAWTETTLYNVVSLGDASVVTQQTVTSGTYVIAAGAINFTRTMGGPLTFTGSVSGTLLSLLFNGQPFLYSR